jgi:tetratricopeptide (TPR) repeat protein
MGAPAKRWLVLGAVAAVALATRLAVVAATHGLPQFEVPVLDSRFFLVTGRAWADGTPLPARPFFMSPGYTAFVALASLVAKAPAALIIALQVAADVAACVAVAALALRWFGLGSGLVAGLLLALHGPQILFTTRILDATLGSALVALLAWRIAAVEEKPTAARLVVAGLAVGLLATLRSTALALLPLPLLFLAWRWRGDGLVRVAGRGALLLIGVALPIAPVTWRNATAGGEAVLLTSSGGVNFLIGNAPGTDGRFQSMNELPLAPGRFADDPTDGAFERSVAEFAQERSGRKLTAKGVSDFYADLAWAGIEKAPLSDWFGRLARKAWLFANAFEVPQVDNVYFLARYLPAWFAPLAYSSSLLWPLAWFGLVVLWLRRGERPTGALPLLALSYAGAICLFFVTDRYRLWITPLAALGAAATFDSLLRAWRRAAMSGALQSGVVLLVAAVVNLNPARFEPAESLRDPGHDFGGLYRRGDSFLDYRAQHNNMAARCLERGDVERALAECRAGLAQKPDDPTLLLNLARTLVARDEKADPRRASRLAELDEAIAALRASARAQPGNGLVGQILCEALARRCELRPADLAQARELAPLLYERGDPKRSEAVVERWLELAPDDPEAWNLLGANRLKLGEQEAGIEALRSAVAKGPGNTKYVYNLGLALLRTREFAAAAEILAPIVPADAEKAANAAAAAPYAEALAGAGRRDEARALLESMLRRQPDHLAALLTLGELECDDGHLDAARRLLDRALKKNPRSSRALALKNRLGK